MTASPRHVLRLAFLAMGLAIAVKLPASAQEFPNRPVRMLVSYPAGGTTDILARMVADGLSRSLSQPVVVENRPGAGTAIAAQALARAPADGYTLLVTTGSTTALLPLLHSNPGYTADQMTGVAMIGRAPLVLDVPAQSPFRSLAELIAFGRANPGRLNVATQGAGATSHLTAELFAASAGLSMTPVHYQGSAPGLVAIIAGQVDLYFDGVATSAPAIDSGRLRGLAVTSENRMPNLPGVPTMREAGLPDVTVYSWYGILAPAGTPPVVTERLNREVSRIVQNRELQERLAREGAETLSMSVAEVVKYIGEEREMWRRVVAPLNIRMD